MHRKLGSGYQEKYYQKAIRIALQKQGLKFQEQVFTPLTFEGEQIGRYFLDFVIENLIVLEIKSQAVFRKRDFKQVLAYLNAQKLKLGILANFTNKDLVFKRILRGKDISEYSRLN